MLDCKGVAKLSNLSLFVNGAKLCKSAFDIHLAKYESTHWIHGGSKKRNIAQIKVTSNLTLPFHIDNFTRVDFTILKLMDFTYSELCCRFVIFVVFTSIHTLSSNKIA